MYVKCKHCGGIIDPDTLVCIMCAREYKLNRVVSERRRLGLVSGSRQNDHYNGWRAGARLK